MTTAAYTARLRDLCASQEARLDACRRLGGNTLAASYRRGVARFKALVTLYSAATRAAVDQAREYQDPRAYTNTFFHKGRLRVTRNDTLGDAIDQARRILDLWPSADLVTVFDPDFVAIANVRRGSITFGAQPIMPA